MKMSQGVPVVSFPRRTTMRLGNDLPSVLLYEYIFFVPCRFHRVNRIALPVLHALNFQTTIFTLCAGLFLNINQTSREHASVMESFYLK